MIPRRRRGQAAAWEGWNIRESSLGDFLPSSPGIPPSQHNIIEWSSSDEESEQQPTNNTTHSKGQVINLSDNKTLPTSLRTIGRRNVASAKAEWCRDCSFTAMVTQAKTSESKRRLKHDSLKLTSLRTDVGDVSISTGQLLASNSKCQSISNSNQYNNEVNGEASFKMDPFKTPKQAKDDEKRYCRDFKMSPILGVQGCRSTLEEKVPKSASRRSSDDDVDVTEPTSPVLGSQRIVKKRRTLYNFKPFERCSNDFAPRKLSNVPGVSKLCGDMTQDAAKTPDMKVIDPNEDLVRSRIKKRNLSYTFFELESQELSKPEVKKTHYKESLESTKRLSSTQTGSPKKVYDMYFTERTINTDTDCISIDSQFCAMKGRAQWNLQTQIQNNNLPSHSSRISAIRDSLLQNREEKNGDDICIEHTTSQNDIPKSEEPDSQSDVGIDCISSPCKETVDNSGTFSLVSCDPSISTGSAVSPVPVDEETSEKIKTGSDWLKALQQHTPQKPLSKEETEGAMDSAKKKAKKNGLAGRLHRLILSWQSGVHMWTHQMSLTSPQCQKTNTLQKKVFKVDTKPPVLSSHHLGVDVKKEILLDNSHKGFSSSVARNLQNILVESPASSPETSGLSKVNHLRMPKKYLDLRILKVGGRLPSNAALCEVIHSNTKVFPRAMKMENEKEFESEKGKDGYKRKYCVFFALNEQKINITLHVNDIAKVYSPWQCLDLASYSTPIIFTSYFTIQENQFIMNEKQVKEEIINSRSGKRNQPKTLSMGMSKTKKKIILTTWTCTCSGDATVLPSMCEAREHVVHRPLVPEVNNDLTTSSNPGFTVVKDTPEESPPSNEVHPAYTILQAIEKCGGVSDVPVTISIRTHRIISHREAAGEVKEWELVGQDAGGIFCTVKIPNRPLVCHLTDLLEGEGGTHTLTKVTISQRLTNTQDPGLFSLISSLHKAYQDAVRENPLLYSLLQDQASRPPQTYCYVFTVNLGLTDLLHSGEEVVIPVTLPNWSLHEAIQVSCDGQRGSLSLHILYKVGSFLYVVNHSESEESHSSLTTQEGTKHKEKGKIHRKEEDSENYSKKKTLLVTKVMIGSKTVLPSWIPENGTVMQSALLKDAVIWHGSVMVDEYSLIQQQDSKMRVTLLTLHKILQPLSIHTRHHDLTLISGNILRADEESAYTWPTCSHCKSDNVQEMQHGTVDCLACGHNSIPSTGYSLVVWLRCGLDLQNADVKVKLYQRTIEKLLSTCSGAEEQEEGYNAESLAGHHIGPVVCVLEEARGRSRRARCQTYNLTELPY